MGLKTKRTALLITATWLLVATGAGVASAGHWVQQGWTDRHYMYPARPHGLTQINSTFGAVCNTNANHNTLYWTAADNGHSYPVHYHMKLGGGTSSNLGNDIFGHVNNDHLTHTVKSGIWGYNCRKIANSDKWSVHAWGVAVDINSAYEHYGHAHNHTIDSRVANIWQNHRWYWGLNFGGSTADAMHFQYATGY
jgi:hypothetical protein